MAQQLLPNEPGCGKEDAVSLTLGELDAFQTQRLLEGHRLGRLTCHGPGGAASVPVTYSMTDHDHVCVHAIGPCCDALARGQVTVRLEVDETSGPRSWSTVIGWGFVEGPPAGADTYCIRLTSLRGFYRGETRSTD